MVLLPVSIFAAELPASNQPPVATVNNTTTSAVAADIAVKVTDEANQKERLNFERLEKLDEQIQMANKEIAALQMQQQLAKLKLDIAKQERGFTLQRITMNAAGKMLAIFKVDNGGEITVAQGEMIKGDYQAAMITETGVIVKNVVTGEKFNAPREK
jgi:hypothetical protein